VEANRQFVQHAKEVKLEQILGTAHVSDDDSKEAVFSLPSPLRS